ncbi:MAG: malic enzyme-like NAD(P)-binding protein [Pseudomonadota bacterium]
MTGSKTLRPNPSYNFTFQVEASGGAEALERVLALVRKTGCEILSVDMKRDDGRDSVLEINLNAGGAEDIESLGRAVAKLEGVRLIKVVDEVLELHNEGKIETTSRILLTNKRELSMAYTPGVARICRSIVTDAGRAYDLTIKGNTVAVVTDGTAVLGLGDIGPLAAMPVMEGKAILFKRFGGVNAFPICLGTKNEDEIVDTVRAIAPGFGGINLEDISAPRCFSIEERLKKDLDVPVFHDDQHGTAVVVLAALINALKIVDKSVSSIKVVISGVGAAGVAVTNILMAAGVRHIVGCDREGALYSGRKEHMSPVKEEYARRTNPAKERGSLSAVLAGADVFVGVSGPEILKADDVKRMAGRPVVFALANPIPEIMPEEIKSFAAVIATGRSDYPNQINNVLCFPGIFRGALDCRAREINEEMKMAAASAIADLVEEGELSSEYIIPSVFHPEVAPKVAEAAVNAARRTGVARL